ncbi:hypothetical protein LEP1GSC055_2727 [Leptospira borgpetersenii str. Brem 307]|uniref:Uncharacterized protein n=1 Tax=Leptospira borgpetersenii str. Brem 328 TaxID=1049780 RepID=A0ABC9SNK0_LEPBO|nr:hypothetical protein LEP1GSC055_2727 [Leptospira borgpetersenii str. Brem 307]EMN19155.1 hypothetical protein LEP1GSC056_1955 [Leptospira borgpetersenii str. Brem 328]
MSPFSILRAQFEQVIPMTSNVISPGKISFLTFILFHPEYILPPEESI